MGAYSGDYGTDNTGSSEWACFELAACAVCVVDEPEEAFDCNAALPGSPGGLALNWLALYL